MELWQFMRVRKKYWLLPIFIVMALFGALIVLTQGSAVAPFIYTLVLRRGPFVDASSGSRAFYHDAAAALVEDGRIVAAAQEERFSRKKHDAGFPGTRPPTASGRPASRSTRWTTSRSTTSRS